MERDRIIERIRKLLRLSRSENPYEAALAAERVQRMLSEYNLTLEGIVDEETEKARQINRKTRKDLEEWAHILASRTASVFDCRYFHDPNTGETSFVGVGADPEVCGWMYGYLYKTLCATGTPSMSCTPSFVVRPISGNAGIKCSRVCPVPSNTPCSSAPRLPRSAESVFL